MLAESPLLWSLVACGLYMLIGGVTGNLFVFSYALYASSPRREQGAVPMFRADGREAHLGDYRGFVGLDPEGLYPPHTPCSLEWMTHEARRYIGKHLGAEEGPIQVEWGFVWMSVAEDGTIVSEFRPAQTGTAWRR